MPSALIIISAIAYLAILFGLAYIAERRALRKKSLVNNPIIYALSLAVYCTAWTFYGSVGRASSQGIGFLPIYLGPLIASPLLFILLRKIILISKAQRITSIADFISSRYGKSTSLGIIVTVISVLGIIPYISIQLKAIATSFTILSAKTVGQDYQTPFYFDAAWYITIALTLFIILFGTRNLDPNERHEGLVAAVAFESLVKLIAFMAVGVFVTFGLFNGFSDLFQKTASLEVVQNLYTFEGVGVNATEWLVLILLSMSAVLFLPRQFHIGVVENTEPAYLKISSWLFPLYLLLINIFVIPIAIAGLYYLSEPLVDPDAFVLSVPLHFEKNYLALLVGIGGFAAATSMVIVAVIALSIMISNNLVLPILLKPRIWQTNKMHNISNQLIGIRRVSIIVVLLLSYAYFRLVTTDNALVSIGLISFTAIAQFLPAILGGLYWKRGTKAGAIASLLVGFFIWMVTLQVPTLLEKQSIGENIIQNGYFNIVIFKPYALFGLDGWDQITHTTFWSLLLNTATYFTVSLQTRPSALEISQADLFVEIEKNNTLVSRPYEVIRRRAKTGDLIGLLERFLSPEKAAELIQKYEQTSRINFKQSALAPPELIKYVEIHLSGAIGAASAKAIIKSISQEDPVGLEEMFQILEQTKEIYQYSRALEIKSKELEQKTQQLRSANEKLKELDQLKADFISTITHELRTPITSIKAFSKIILDNEELGTADKEKFLNIILSESDRITRLVNQVLDLKKIEAELPESSLETFNLTKLAKEAFESLIGLMEEKEINHEYANLDPQLYVNGNKDKLFQVVINLLSNAIKFSDPVNGKVSMSLLKKNHRAVIEIRDNGKGISPEDVEIIFDKFTQISDQEFGKPKGSGLGLFITKTIVSQHHGFIYVKNEDRKGATFVVELPLTKPVFA